MCNNNLINNNIVHVMVIVDVAHVIEMKAMNHLRKVGCAIEIQVCQLMKERKKKKIRGCIMQECNIDKFMKETNQIFVMRIGTKTPSCFYIRDQGKISFKILHFQSLGLEFDFNLVPLVSKCYNFSFVLIWFLSFKILHI